MTMKYTFPITKEMVTAKSTLSASEIHANTVCRAINTKPFVEAKAIIEGLANETKPLKKRYYTKTAGELLKVLNSIESNATARKMDAHKMKLYISVHRGPTLYRLRRKWNFGRRMKVCHVQAVLKGETIGTGEKVRSAGN